MLYKLYLGIFIGKRYECTYYNNPGNDSVHACSNIGSNGIKEVNYNGEN